jgi:AraC-like DNA-binding protein
VAARLGYDSTSSFIALFQAKFRMTPGAYAKREARRPVLSA